MWGKIGRLVLSFFLEKIWGLGTKAWKAWREDQKAIAAEQLRQQKIAQAEAEYKAVLDDPNSTLEEKENAFTKFVDASRPSLNS